MRLKLRNLLAKNSSVFSFTIVDVTDRACVRTRSMSAGDEKDTTDIEAAVLSRLFPSDWEKSDIAPRSVSHRERSNIKFAKKSRKRRKSALDTEANPSSVKDFVPFQNKIIEAASVAEKGVLDQMIIRRAGSSGHSISGKQRISPPANKLQTAPIVVKALDLLPQSQERHGKTWSPGSKDKKKKRGVAEDLEATEYVDKYRREVGRFGSQALQKRDRKSFEAAERLRLGCRAPKNQKMPIATLIAKRKKQKSLAAKKKEMDLAAGMLVRSKRR